MTTNPTTTGKTCRWCPENEGKPIDPSMRDGVCEKCYREQLERLKHREYIIVQVIDHQEVRTRSGRVAYWCWTYTQANEWIDAQLTRRIA
jgi:hypothetical protein